MRPEEQSVRPEGQSARPEGQSVRPEGQSSEISPHVPKYPNHIFYAADLTKRSEHSAAPEGAQNCARFGPEVDLGKMVWKNGLENDLEK